MRASILTSMLGHFFSVLFSSHVLEIVCIRRIQSVTRASQRKSTPETRRDCSRAPRDLAKRDAMIGSTTNTGHHFKSAPFLFYLYGSSRANTSVDGVARVPSISRGETTRHPSWSGHTYLDNARDATVRIHARTHDAFGVFMLHARACVTVTSRRRLARRVVEWRIPIARRLDTEPAPREYQSAPRLCGVSG